MQQTKFRLPQQYSTHGFPAAALPLRGLQRAILAFCLFWLASGGAVVYGQARISCAGQPYCSEVTPFIARIKDFRPSSADRTKILTATIQFQNRLNRPVALAYVGGSGVAIDDQGNRYSVYGPTAVRAIGEIAANGQVDPKFILQPGETADARFEFSWRPSGNEIYGQAFQLELTVREVLRLPSNQLRLGQEHLLQFRGLSGNLSMSSPSAAPVRTATAGAMPVQAAPAQPAAVLTSAATSAQASQAAQPPAPSVAPAAPIANACGSLPRCFAAGPFIAEVVQATGSVEGTYKEHFTRFTVRFRNLTNQPIILAYVSGTNVVIDNNGTRYYWGVNGTYDRSVTGIGVATPSRANSDFVLNPGESRNATFVTRRDRDSKAPLGTAYNFEFAVDQLEMINASQIRTVRQYSVSFPNVTLSSGGVGAFTSGVSPASAESLSDTAKKFKDLFKKR